MSFGVIFVGKLVDTPELRTPADPSKKPFVTAKVATAMGAPQFDGRDEYPASVMAYGEVGEQLLQLSRGDMVAVTGRAQIRLFTGREDMTCAALSVIATAVLPSHQGRRVKRFKRELAEQDAQPTPSPTGQDDA